MCPPAGTVPAQVLTNDATSIVTTGMAVQPAALNNPSSSAVVDTGTFLKPDAIDDPGAPSSDSLGAISSSAASAVAAEAPVDSIPSALTSSPLTHRSLRYRQGCQQYQLPTSEECSTAEKRIDHARSDSLGAVSIHTISSSAASADKVRALVDRTLVAHTGAGRRRTPACRCAYPRGCRCRCVTRGACQGLGLAQMP